MRCACGMPLILGRREADGDRCESEGGDEWLNAAGKVAGVDHGRSFVGSGNSSCGRAYGTLLRGRSNRRGSPLDQYLPRVSSRREGALSVKFVESLKSDASGASGARGCRGGEVVV